MTKSRFESNSEKAPAYPELEAARAKLEEMKAQARTVEDRIRDIMEIKRTAAAREGDIFFLASELLEGKANALPTRDFDAELTALFRQREVVQKAAQIQQGRLDEAVRLASGAEYRKRKPAYISEIKKMVAGVKAIEEACAGMQAIKNEMTAAGFRDIFPAAGWPGLNPGGFQRQRESFEFYLQQQGLGEALK